jgi:hypothetical protein
LRLAATLARSGPMKVSALKSVSGIDKTAAILQRDVYGWFTRVERGVYTLSQGGQTALTTYADVVGALAVG